MKHGKKPTVKQKIFLHMRGLNPNNWLICQDTAQEVIAQHRDTLSVKVMQKMQ